MALNPATEISGGVGEESGATEASKRKTKESGVERGGAAAAAAKLGEEKEARRRRGGEAAATTLRDNQSGAEKGETLGGWVRQ